MKHFKFTKSTIYRIKMFAISGGFLWLAFTEIPDIQLGSFPIEVEETVTLIEPAAPEPSIVASSMSSSLVKATKPQKTGMTVPTSLSTAPPHVRHFVKRWLPVAADMFERYGVHTSSQLAQSAKETGWGQKGKLVGGAHNYFGIKCKEKTHNHSKCVSAYDAHWVKYNTAWESWKHHAQFLNGKRYAHCLEKKSVFSYNICIAQAGYCHPPDGYGEDINEIIATYGLDAFDGLTKEEAKVVASKIR